MGWVIERRRRSGSGDRGDGLHGTEQSMHDVGRFREGVSGRSGR